MFKMLWIDMEMTGLDIDKEVPIEVALVATDTKFETLGEYHSVIKQPQSLIDGMDSWNTKHHGESGLTALIPTGNPLEVVEQAMIEFCEKHFAAKERIILCGNSIAQDRLFINKFFKKFNEKLHYRMLDVTSFKIIFNNFYQISYAKPQTQHRAVDDIHQSIKELQKYLSYIKL